MVQEAQGASIDLTEVEKFTKMAAEWWDPYGKFKPLHQLNPARLAFIKTQLCVQFNRDPNDVTPLAGLRLLDVGCGGGLLCEPLTRLGAQMVGIDVAERNISVAKLHAEQSGLEIDYQHISAESLAQTNAKFDAVIMMEVVEHVANVEGFLQTCTQLLRSEGLMIVSTLNRNPKSFAMAIVGAEYILKWLPKGTHDWRKFITPQELIQDLAKTGISVVDKAGFTFQPLRRTWRVNPKDLSVNYVLAGVRADESL